MYYLSMSSQDICRNLATEEYLLTKWNKSEPLLLFYIQKPSIIIGKNQDYYAELNLPYVTNKQITVTRRLSGGGAVYDDLGNLSFSLVTRKKTASFGNFKELTQPILAAIQQLGATQATLSGRNDLVIDGQKFSGNAMYQKGDKLFCHGTLMYDVNLDVLPKALAVAPEKLAAHHISSVRSRVTNLKPYLEPKYQNLSTAEFRDQLLRNIFKVANLNEIQDKIWELTPTEETIISELVTTRYANPLWVKGEKKQRNYIVKERFPFGTIEVRFELIENQLQKVKIFGDYFSQKNSEILEKALENSIFEVKVLEQILSTFDLTLFFGAITPRELATLIVKGGTHD